MNTSLSGRTFHWTFTEGPTKGSTYEHVFDDEGVGFRKVDDGKPTGNATRANKYAAFEVSPQITLVSYLATESGYTLTVAMNSDTGKIYGFASNDKEWYPVSGTFEAR